MRTIKIDQFEFARSDTEKSLEIAIAKKSDFPFPTVQQFIASAVGLAESKALKRSIPFTDVLGYGFVRKYLLEYAGLDLPSPCNWPTYVLKDGPDDWLLVLCAPDCFVSYEWGTSA